METITKSPEETEELGERIANSLKGGETLALVGELGSGKTTFVKGLAKGLGIEQRIISPTFIILRKYRIKLKVKQSLALQAQGSKLKATTKNLNLKNFYHMDLYRLEQNVESEVKNLGIKDIWNNPENVIAIEWAEKITGMIPPNTIWIKFEYISEHERKVISKD